MKHLWLLLLCFPVCSCVQQETTETPVAEVRRGVFTEEITEEGEIRALNSTVISVPRNTGISNFRIVKIVRDGSEVEQGDTLVWFDPQETQRLIENNEELVERNRAELEELIQSQISEIQEAEANLESQRISFEISKLRTELTSYEPEITRMEKSLNLKSSEQALERARLSIENTKKLNLENLTQKQGTVAQYERRLQDALNMAQNMCILSPSPGIAMVRSGRTVGTNIYQGNALIDLPDLSVMTANLNINEVDVAKLQVGQRATIRPDAYSDTVFKGEVYSIANLAQNKDYRSGMKVFPVVVKIEGRNRQLLPGLTVSCKIVISEQPDVLYIPIEAVFKDEMGEYVYVKVRSNFKRREVKIGAQNTDFAVVLEGLEEGDKLALADPFLNVQAVAQKNGAGKTSQASSTKN